MPNDRFVRIRQLIGSRGLQKLHDSRVAVVGLGAVGSYASEALARAGVGHLRLVDFDIVRHSNINRQLFALESTLGLSKAETASRRVIDINPACEVQPLQLFVDSESLEAVLGGTLNVLIDAIDSVGPKIELLTGAAARGTRVVSCMGAALRTDPTQVQVGRLADVHHCPLARRVRKELRKRGVSLDLCCIYSTEPVGELRKTAITFDRPEGEDCVQRGRKRSLLGSLPTLTGIIGLTAANTVLKLLLGEDFPGGGR
ncbi:MAG: tRNA threonylcarbamoyladenosine dehydratase [Acidobacteria bacterium]|nr:MAG: tRNA threonylcarbamoyladenosine dehydratase [Acidobacteriota bacterium]